MTRIKTLSTIAMTFFASLSFMACQKQTPSESKEATNLSTNAQPIKLAYVEVDSIMTRYQFATEYAAVLKKKMETIQSTLNNKGLALQKDVADFQNKIQQGSITQEQATAMQSALQKKQAQLQNLQESLTAQYQEMQDTYNKALYFFTGTLASCAIAKAEMPANAKTNINLFITCHLIKKTI